MVSYNCSLLYESLSYSFFVLASIESDLDSSISFAGSLQGIDFNFSRNNVLGSRDFLELKFINIWTEAGKFDIDNISLATILMVVLISVVALKGVDVG